MITSLEEYDFFSSMKESQPRASQAEMEGAYTLG